MKDTLILGMLFFMFAAFLFQTHRYAALVDEKSLLEEQVKTLKEPEPRAKKTVWGEHVANETGMILCIIHRSGGVVHVDPEPLKDDEYLALKKATERVLRDFNPDPIKFPTYTWEESIVPHSDCGSIRVWQKKVK